MDEASSSSEPPSLFHRVDARLVHSALAHAWLPFLRTDRLVLADAVVAGDSRLREICQISTPQEVVLSCCSETDAAAILREVARGSSAVVVFRSLGAALSAYEAGLRMPHLNIGHVPAGLGRREVCPAVWLGPSDLAIIAFLRRRHVHVEVRPLPGDSPLDPLSPAFSPQSPAPTSLGKRRGVSAQGLGVLSARGVTLCPAAPEGGGLSDWRSRLLPPSRSAWEPSSSGVTGPEGDLLPEKCEPVHRVVRSITVECERGLHLRVANRLVEFVAPFRSSVHLGRDGRFVNARSLLGLTTLAAAAGVTLTVVADGPDAQEAVDALESFFGSSQAGEATAGGAAWLDEVVP